ncbi:hypothetical protein GX411_06360 [Candidatus Fermentibacteria bacterium]|nr:hypothetical protein [Candidatus Fermentibacteria bacterium]
MSALVLVLITVFTSAGGQVPRLSACSYDYDFAWNTCGDWNHPNSYMKNQNSYGTYSVTVFQVPLEADPFLLVESIEFCVAGTQTLEAGIWLDLPDMGPPGPPGTEDISVQFLPVVPQGHEDSTGVAYTPVNVSSGELAIIHPGEIIAFGCSLEPGTYIGMENGTPADGAVTYSWWLGDWDPDAPWHWIPCMQIGCSDWFGLSPSTWGGIKTLF